MVGAMTTRLPRWTWLLVLPTLVGALLLMHGLNAHAAAQHPSDSEPSALVAAEHSHDEPAPADHGECLDCLAGHAMAACVAILAAVIGIGLARRLLTRGGLVSPVLVVAGQVRSLIDLARPPDPAWVRLSVMRC